jgi:hypothetical protein
MKYTKADQMNIERVKIENEAELAAFHYSLRSEQNNRWQKKGVFLIKKIIKIPKKKMSENRKINKLRTKQINQQNSEAAPGGGAS